MTTPTSVTCTERVRMNATFGLIFLFGGDLILLYALMGDNSGGFGTAIVGACGVVGMLLGLYYMCCFLNKKITVSDDGVTYVNWMAKRQNYTWDQVSVSFHPGRNAYFIFDLNGKRVKFYGYANNAQALYDYLYDNGHFDDDTMRVLHRIEEEAAEREHQLQLEEEADAAFWDEDENENN